MFVADEADRRGRALLDTPQFRAVLDSVADWLTATSERAAKSTGLYLYGTVGCGKTTMMTAARNLIAAVRGRVELRSEQFLPEPHTINACELHTVSVSRYGHEGSEFDQLAARPLLLIDDLGVETPDRKSYGNTLSPMSDLLAIRYERRLPTIITSNLSPGKIRERYDYRMADRMAEDFYAVDCSALGDMRRATAR